MRTTRLVAAWVFGALSVGCASTTTSRPAASVSDIYFTNADSGPGFQFRNAGDIHQIMPEVRVFDRARDSKIRMVVVFSDGNAHKIDQTLITPAGNTYSGAWSVPLLSSFSRWRSASYWWSLNANWAAGRSEVEVRVDGAPGGTHSFEVK
jgi:hypothetical protein